MDSSDGKQRNPTTVPQVEKDGSNSNLSIAMENEGSSTMKKDRQFHLESWDSYHYYWRKFLIGLARWSDRQVRKHIHASPQVLHTYHDSFLYGQVPRSVRIRTRIRSGLFGKAWSLLEFFLALLSGVLYVYYTYNSTMDHNWVFRIQNAISIAFLADYALRVYSEPVRLYFIFSLWGIVDLITTLPIILVFRYNIHGANLIRLLQFVRIVRISALISTVGVFGSSVVQQIILLCIAVFGVLILDAGILQWVEYHLAPASTRASCSTQGCITFWQSFYFMIVTISTVGYGDISPATIVGQLIAILTILAALTILPIQIGRITTLALRRPYGGSFSTRKIIGSRFLIISGSVTFAAIQNFLAEFYNGTHNEDLEIYPLRVIILAPFTPSFELKQTLSLYNGLVEFIEGSPVRQSDLERVSADRAAAFFLLADKDVENYVMEDAAQVVRSLAVHRYCHATRNQHRVRIIVEVLDPETHSSAVWDEAHTQGIEVICPVKVHYNMLARSCAVHGLYTLITNLFTGELPLKHINSNHFLTEYFHSFDNEIYPVVFPQSFHNLSFEEVAEILFVKFQSTLLAIDTVIGYNSNGRLDRRVLLYPRKRRILFDDVGLIICSALHTAYAISTYQPDDQRPGILDSLWVQAKAAAPTRKRDKQGTEMIDVTSAKWSPDSSSVHRDSSPFSPNVGRKLEHEFKSAIQNSFSMDHDGSDSREVGTTQSRDVEDPDFEFKRDLDTKSPSRRGTPTHELPCGKSLLKAAEDLLAWPPAVLNDKPHPAVIEEKEDVIMKHLKSNTITVATFNTPHILVCCQNGWPSNLFYFLLQLRKPGFPNPPVVVLYPNQVKVQEWGVIGPFPDVFFLKGSPIYELDLLRGGALHAAKIVVLSDQGAPVDLGGDPNKYLKRAPAAYTSDVENVVIAANVQRLYGLEPANVIVEMQHPDAFFYLRPQYDISRSHFPALGLKRNRDALVHFVPPFMAGRAVSSTMLAFLMRSSFYNRNTQTIVDQLINGGPVMTENGLEDNQPIILDQIPVPDGYRNRPYSDLFLGLLREKEMLAIGLYRAQGTLTAPTAYVFTNPLPHHIVSHADLVYILR